MQQYLRFTYLIRPLRSYYDVEQKAFVADAGTYAILLGKSAGEIIDVAEIKIM